MAGKEHETPLGTRNPFEKEGEEIVITVGKEKMTHSQYLMFEVSDVIRLLHEVEVDRVLQLSSKGRRHLRFNGPQGILSSMAVKSRTPIEAGEISLSNWYYDEVQGDHRITDIVDFSKGFELLEEAGFITCVGNQEGPIYGAREYVLTASSLDYHRDVIAPLVEETTAPSRPDRKPFWRRK